ncbi:hypothetical protein H8356DRAFT_1425681 [Neocallimastix lanati (nom. inval.)]|nr:hypothetical protein H8356DRAFT_1425681 [Neocallimastix sp. JGI-2020a]
MIEKGVKSYIKEKEELKSSLKEAHKIIDLQHEKIERVNEENNNFLNIIKYSLTPSNNNSKHSLLRSMVNLSKALKMNQLKSILNSLYEKYNVLEQTYHLVIQRLEYQKSANQDIKKMIVTAQIEKALDNNNEKYNKKSLNNK